MDNSKRDFDTEAAAWDTLPRVKLAEDVAAAMIAEVKINRAMDVLDFGCGTGLLSLHFQPLAHSVTGADASRGMLDVFRHKIDARKLSNVRLVPLDLSAAQLKGAYHLIVTTMTLHHIPDIGPLLKQFHHVLLPGGFLCVADLDPENGVFHADKTGVFHNGFDRSALSGELAGAGFTEIRQRTAATVTKPDDKGMLHRFTVFLLTGRKM